MAKTQRWTNGPVYLFRGRDDCLGIRAVRAGDDASMIFKTDQLADLFASILAAKKPVRLNSFRMIRESGYVEAEIPQENKKTGKSYAYAFTAESVAQFAKEAKSMTLRAKWTEHGPQPILMCFDTEWEKPEAAGKLERVNASKPAEGLTRAKA